MDPRWWYRIGLAVVLTAFLVLLARVSILAFKPEASRIDQAESKAMGKGPAAPAPAEEAAQAGIRP